MAERPQPLSREELRTLPDVTRKYVEKIFYGSIPERTSAVHVFFQPNQPELVRKALIYALYDSDNIIKLGAINALGKNPHNEAIPHLIAMLEHRNPLIKINAIKALENHRGNEIPDAVKEILDKEKTTL